MQKLLLAAGLFVLLGGLFVIQNQSTQSEVRVITLREDLDNEEIATIDLKATTMNMLKAIIPDDVWESSKITSNWGSASLKECR